jgi:hypothetical protein
MVELKILMVYVFKSLISMGRPHSRRSAITSSRPRKGAPGTTSADPPSMYPFVFADQNGMAMLEHTASKTLIVGVVSTEK